MQFVICLRSSERFQGSLIDCANNPDKKSDNHRAWGLSVAFLSHPS